MTRAVFTFNWWIQAIMWLFKRAIRCAPLSCSHVENVATISFWNYVFFYLSIDEKSIIHLKNFFLNVIPFGAFGQIVRISWYAQVGTLPISNKLTNNDDGSAENSICMTKNVTESNFHYQKIIKKNKNSWAIPSCEENGAKSCTTLLQNTPLLLLVVPVHRDGKCREQSMEQPKF